MGYPDLDGTCIDHQSPAPGPEQESFCAASFAHSLIALHLSYTVVPKTEHMQGSFWFCVHAKNVSYTEEMHLGHLKVSN